MSDRLDGLVVVVPSLALVGLYCWWLSKHGRRRPWLLLAGAAVLAVALLVPLWPLSAVGIAVMSYELYLRHQDRYRRTNPAGRPRRHRAHGKSD